MGARDPWRTAARVLAVMSVLAFVGATTVVAVSAVRDRPAASAGAYDGWRVVRGDGASYRVPPGWHVGAAGELVSYRDERGVPYARGTALSTYDGNACPGGADHPGAWALLADPVRSADLEAVAVAAARQWARGFGTGRRGTGRVSAPRVERLELAGGTPAVAAHVSLDLRGLDNPCRQASAELTVVAAPAGDVSRLLVVARHPDVEGGVPDGHHEAVAGSLAVSTGSPTG